MSTQSDRNAVAKAKDLLNDFFGIFTAQSIVDSLLKVPPPRGNGDAVRQLADQFGNSASKLDTVGLAVTKVTQQDLPEVWVGVASEAAGDVLVAVAEDLERTVGVFGKARGALDTLSDALAQARTMHANAQDPLHRAKAAGDDLAKARSLGIEGANQLLAALDTAINAGKQAGRDLSTLATQARAHQLDSGNLSASDRLVLGESAVPGGPHDVNLILNETDAERATQRLDKLSPQDRQRFDDLLRNAKSPQERAYLLKTLAAGHSVDEISQFDGLIHNHGDDPVWLQEHLTPIVNRSHDTSTSASSTGIDYKGGSWTQGSYPTCVASSTVMARAMVDPMYTLQLTTGGKPDDPKASSKDAFLDRLRHEQQAVYDDGRSGRDGDRSLWDKMWGNHDNTPGMYPNEGQKVENKDIGAYNGVDYQHHDLGSADDRRGALHDVETSVDQGKPIPVQVRDSHGGHQMMIISHQGNMLEIYNPWGDTNWVSEDDFINGHMGKVDSGVPNTVTGVDLPK
jgi:hypothetical protein